MPSIGGRSVISCKWNREEIGYSWRDITAPWADGYAFQQMGKRAQASQAVTVVDLSNATACNNEFTLYKAMQDQGTGVTVIDDHGRTTRNVKVLRVSIADQYKIKNGVGGVNNGDYILICVWMLQETE